MKRNAFISAVFAVTAILLVSGAEGFSMPAPNETLTQLLRQGIYLKALLPMVESQDAPRVRHLLQLNERAAASLDQLGPLHKETTEALQIWAIAFSYSKSFWKLVDSERGTVAIQSINESTDRIFTKSGLQAEASSHVTQGLFRQMVETLMVIEKLPGLEKIHDTLLTLKATFGRVLSAAEGGDRPQAFKVAVPASQALDQAIDQMIYLLSSKAVSESILQLQVLNELFKEFSQVPRTEESVR